jgi:hypothetical protein
MEQEIEIWLPVADPRFSWMYEASSHGRIRSIDIIKDNGKGGKYVLPGRLRKINTANNGYPMLCLTGSDGKKYNCTVHRLIAKTHVPNPHNYPVVNHTNGNKLDARAINLEWVEQESNLKHAVDTGLRRPDGMRGKSGTANKRSKKIMQCDEQGNVVRLWNSLRQTKEVGFSPGNICQVLKGNRDSHKGFIWKYLEDAS